MRPGPGARLHPFRGPYCYQNTDIRGYGWYTNQSARGRLPRFGVCQSEFALESLIDLLADEVGISPWEIRYRNAIEPGKVLPNGQIADRSTALKETLLAVRDVYEAHPGHAGHRVRDEERGRGVGLPDAGRCRIRVEGGRARVYSATSDIGQGCNTVFLQDVAEATGLPLASIANGECSTENAPDSGTTSGSRQTLITGEAVRGAAFLLRDAMLAVEEGAGAPGAPGGRPRRRRRDRVRRRHALHRAGRGLPRGRPRGRAGCPRGVRVLL